jgi:putative FmdB family regulatory protein
MPNYEFSCDECGTHKIIESSVYMDVPTPSCDACVVSMRRVWSAPPVKFNASGFYSTDNKSR